MLGLPSLKSKNCFEKYLRIPEKIESRFQKTPEFLQIIWLRSILFLIFLSRYVIKVNVCYGFPSLKKKKIH